MTGNRRVKKYTLFLLVQCKTTKKLHKMWKISNNLQNRLCNTIHA